jgi:hypothetical protein
VLRKRVAVLVAAAVMLAMLAASAPVFAQGTGGCDTKPGQTERTSSPPQGHPGAIHSDNPDSAGNTGFGDRVTECT